MALSPDRGWKAAGSRPVPNDEDAATVVRRGPRGTPTPMSHGSAETQPWPPTLIARSTTSHDSRTADSFVPGGIGWATIERHHNPREHEPAEQSFHQSGGSDGVARERTLDSCP